jgi:gamma-glutamyl hercynylcysteine S-oxide synthase
MSVRYDFITPVLSGQTLSEEPRTVAATIPHPAPDREQIATLLEEARSRTLLLVSNLSDDDLHRQHDPLMSPIIWDLGHIAHFEELWLTRNLEGKIEFSEMPGLYNPFEHPRATRAALTLPTLAEMKLRMSEIRERVLERLEKQRFDEDNQLLRGALVYHMVLQHEYQHNETILQTLQLKLGEPYHPPERFSIPPGTGESTRTVSFPGGVVTIGTDDARWSYDNERPCHAMHLAPFDIDAFPVTNGEYAEFIDDGGYDDERHWSLAGRAWLAQSQARGPKYWDGEGDARVERNMDLIAPLQLDRPVCHVCYYEAEAFAKWAGKRLPTEFEWEAAASWSAGSGATNFPWGNEVPNSTIANVDELSFQPASLGAYPKNVSALGCYGMIGDVWEWTSSEFRDYPGFRSFPYKEYSEEFFGSEYRVLRGGSWATRPHAIRNTFRNWDYPIRRQIFSGFRCASDL